MLAFFVMNTFYTYIIFSKAIDRYYIGYTANLEKRLQKHNANHKGYTGRANDWKIVYFESCDSKEGAYARERELKKWKDRRQLEKLILEKGSEHSSFSKAFMNS